LYAYFNEADHTHEAVVSALSTCDELLTISPFVLAEVDYLVLKRLGVKTELLVLGELLSGAWDIAPVTIDQLRRAMDVVKRYADERIGLTDALNVVLAEDTRTKTIATLDRRHFGVLRMANGSVLGIVP